MVIKAKCPKCGQSEDVSIDLLNQLWNEGSQLTIKCKKCNTFYRGEW